MAFLQHDDRLFVLEQMRRGLAWTKPQSPALQRASAVCAARLDEPQAGFACRTNVGVS
jgi:hypothetical protein